MGSAQTRNNFFYLRYRQFVSNTKGINPLLYNVILVLRFFYANDILHAR